MNRDESLLRPVAMPPRVVRRGDRVAVVPQEPEGGSWIGVNDAGLCVALINWYAIAKLPGSGRVSRGIVVPALLKAGAAQEAKNIAHQLPKQDMAPFRLLIFARREREVTEFRWDQRKFAVSSHAWEPRHWFSSGYDEAEAQRERAKVARAAWGEPDAARLPWLRRLHGSHLPSRGPFCFCMHRRDAATVSYTEIAMTSRKATLRYHCGPLCRVPEASTVHRILLSEACKESQPASTNEPNGHAHEDQQHSFQSTRRTILPVGFPACCEVHTIAGGRCNAYPANLRTRRA